MHSVIIPTYNRRESLLRAVNSLVKQTFSASEYEIIVIDDGSTDDTGKQISNLKSQISKPEIRYFKTERGGSTSAKNFGIKQARGEIIFFTDDDCAVPLNWMATLLAGYEKYPDIAGAGGWYVPPKDERRFFQKTAHLINKILYSTYGDRERIIGTLPVSVASIPNVSYKKSVLEEIGGFDENISPLGSVELKYRLMTKSRKKILYVPTSVIHHCPLGFFAYIGRFFRQGRCKQYCNKKHFNGRPPLVFDVSFSRAPQKLFRTLSWAIDSGKVAFADLPAIFAYFILETFFNSCGGLFEKYMR